MDISSLRERRSDAYTVSELNNFIKSLFENNRTLNAVTVKGEISNFTNHRSGHLYFSLKDSEGQIRAVMFRSRASLLKFAPENGMKVILHGSVTVYPRDGSYQLYVNSMQPDGVGALYLAYEQLKARLSEEGLFDELYKKPLPRLPRAIGVITSAQGAAVQDIINVTGRRYPLATIYVYPALVQGDGAEADLVAGIDYFDKSGLVDVVIIGRGGGSIEDLWAFNSEKLARRIFAASVPVISAVGHETDFTICDFVSDKRAPTPSAAAELAVPDMRELMRHLDHCYDRLDNALIRKADSAAQRLEKVKERLSAEAMYDLLSPLEERVEYARAGITDLISKMINNAETKLSVSAGKLDALSPLSVLSRGYAIVNLENKRIKSVNDVSVGDRISVRLTDGEIHANVEDR